MITARPAIPSAPESLWDEVTTARYLECSIQKLQQDRHFRRGIPFIKLGRSVRYDPNDVRAYIDRAKVSTVDRSGSAK